MLKGCICFFIHYSFAVLLLPLDVCSYPLFGFQSVFFSVSDFSLNSWIDSNVAGVASQVQGALLQKLLNDLGIAQYLKADECSVDIAGKDSKGWASGSSYISLFI